jgi:hypothetical protein
MKQWQEEIYKLYTEGKQFEAGKYHPRFSKTSQELRKKGVSAPARDAIHFISNLLEYVGIFSEEETDSVVKNNIFAEKRMRFLELLDIHSKEIKSSAADIEENYSSQFDRYFEIESANRGRFGRKSKYSDNAANIEMKKQQKEELQKLKSAASGGAADALDVLSTVTDEADKDLGETLGYAYSDDPDTHFEIWLSNPGFVNKVIGFIKDSVPENVEIEVNDASENHYIEDHGDPRWEDLPDRPDGGKYTGAKKIIEFTVGPDNNLAIAAAKGGRERIEKILNDWLEENTSGGGAAVHPPAEKGILKDILTPRRPRFSINDLNEPSRKGGDEDEYGSDLPEMPEMRDEGDAREFYREPKRDIGDEDEFAGDEGYTPKWAQEEEEGYDDEEDDDYYNQRYKDTYGDEDNDSEDEDDDEGYDDYEGRPLKGYKPKWANEENEDHPGSRRSPEEGEYDDLYYDKEAFNKADLNDDEELSKYERKRSQAINKAMKKKKEKNNENIKMSPQQMNQWMYMQRAQRMQNNLRQNEKWGNY